MGRTPDREPSRPIAPRWCLPVAIGAGAIGLGLLIGQAFASSATYDEVAYLEIGARWWRTGQQESISRMGSPLTFWKIQQAPTLWLLDRLGRGDWIDAPIAHQASLLPWLRVGGAWIWLVAAAITAAWARSLGGPRGMAMAACLIAFGPNVQAHAPLATMETPLLAASAAMGFGFWRFLARGDRRAFWASAAVGGLAFSCKFTTVVFPPIFAATWAVDLWHGRDRGRSRPAEAGRIACTVARGMFGYVAVLLVANLVVTGFATLPLSIRTGSHPIVAGRVPPALEEALSRLIDGSYPQDWVGFATQVMHQRNGGPSYLLGEVRTEGWRHYYAVVLAVKLPLAALALLIARAAWSRRVGRPCDRAWILPAIAIAFVLAASIGSKRNYGYRYLLPLAAPAIAWVSGLAEGGRWARRVGWAGVVGVVAATASIHPHELTYFNELAGGPIGGRRVLSDSNLDWGQGARALARLQAARPELRDLTCYLFGECDPAYYGVKGHPVIFDAIRIPAGMPAELRASTKYLAVSASLQYGPWAPSGYFRRLVGIEPIAYTDDATIAIYRSTDVFGRPDR